MEIFTSIDYSSSNKKVSLLEGESGLTAARKIYPTRCKPDRACLAACLAEAARGTDIPWSKTHTHPTDRNW